MADISDIAYVLILNTEIEFRLTHNIIHLFNALSIVFLSVLFFLSKMIDHRVMDADLSVWIKRFSIRITNLCDLWLMRLFVLWWTGSFSTCTHMVMSHLVWKFVLWYTFNRVLVWLDCFVLIVQVFFVSPLFRLHRYGICHYGRCQCLARWRLENKAMMQPLRRKLDRPSIPYGMNNDIFSVENLQFFHICLF